MRDIRPLSQPRPTSPPPRDHRPGAEDFLPTSLPAIAETRFSSRPKRRRSSTLWLLVLLCVLGGVFWFGLLVWKERLMTEGVAGFTALEQSARALQAADMLQAKRSLETAVAHFERGNQMLFGLSHLLPVLDKLPGLSEVTSGIALMRSGAELGSGAETLLKLFDTSKTYLTTEAQPSLIDLISLTEREMQTGSQAFGRAMELFRYVNVESIPEERRAHFAHGEELLTVLSHALTLSVEHTDLLKELIGYHGPRTYLFLFQNNHELRPTGGFIGSYALLEMKEGIVRRFFVDGIFNPDGQLKENIVPPQPIQKISAGWSLHDSNWFPDFPTSAEKAMFFYEKTGGPTTDGVVALTPEVLRRLLVIMGPIDLPEYALTIDAENFLPLIQEEVEVNYDKEENNPKKILGDLTGVMLRRLVERPESETIFRLADTLVALLNERHVLLYARDARAEQLIETAGWSGDILETPYDYLSVIHTNINGYKTDGVIDDSIEHVVNIEADGSIIDTVSITRRHRGGGTPYEWWNKVNANYMRVYVPLGSELLSAEGMTREFPEPPLDYDALGFRRDAEVVEEEGMIRIDEESGTRIGEEFGKTVFGNWVYVSPGESVTVTYRYRLPFRLARSDAQEPAPFSILYQKQSGTSLTELSGGITYGSAWQSIWQSEENLVPYGRTLNFKRSLKQNVFVGTVLQPTRE